MTTVLHMNTYISTTEKTNQAFNYKIDLQSIQTCQLQTTACSHVFNVPRF